MRCSVLLPDAKSQTNQVVFRKCDIRGKENSVEAGGQREVHMKMLGAISYQSRHSDAVKSRHSAHVVVGIQSDDVATWFV